MAVLEHIYEVRGVAADFAGTMLSKHERYYGLGMDAAVSVCSRNTNVVLWFGRGCSGNRMLSKHERYYGLGMDAVVIVCSSFSRSCPQLFAARPALQPSWLASPAPWPTPRGPSPPSASTNHRAPWQEKLF